MREVLCLVILSALLAMHFGGVAFADDENDDDEKAKIDALEKRISALENEKKEAEEKIDALDWEKDRDYFLLPNGWTISCHGEFRSRALIEGNTVNGYTNYAGERVYAYDPRSTLSNDYGWWDYRLQFRTLVNFGNRADLISKIQVGDMVWGNRSPTFGHRGDAKFDFAPIMFRELWARVHLDPIPLTLEFGKMPWELGNRLIQGNEYEGARTNFSHEYFQVGFGAFRQYEGENYEMEMAVNDDEDTFVAWFNVMPSPAHTLSLFGWVDDLKVTAKPNQIDAESPLWLLPGFDQDLYEGQESQLFDVGINYVGRMGPVKLNLEYDHQFGTLNANPDYDAENIDFKGFGGIAKLDWNFFDTEFLVLTGGYGSGDDPDTVDYEGFFAPDNDFGIKEEDMYEYRERGYFSVYEHLSPGAGVPGKLRDNLGTGGIENTIFANLGWDSNFQMNHHYWLSVGYIQAARENPKTNDDMIGIETDARVDYIFSNNVIFAIYGGHLFVLGDYFREDAHDAAQVYFEWKLVW